MSDLYGKLFWDCEHDREAIEYLMIEDGALLISERDIGGDRILDVFRYDTAHKYGFPFLRECFIVEEYMNGGQKRICGGSTSLDQFSWRYQSTMPFMRICQKTALDEIEYWHRESDAIQRFLF